MLKALITIGLITSSSAQVVGTAPFAFWQRKQTLEPGAVMEDGSVYAGMTPDGNVKMFATAIGSPTATLRWNNGNISGVVATGITNLTTGAANTAALVSIDSDSGTAGFQPHQAAQYCADLVVHGKSDWYLPAKSELNTLYTNASAIGGFDLSSSGWYWSSTEGVRAWIQRFSDGLQHDNTKYSSGVWVRCVRKE